MRHFVMKLYCCFYKNEKTLPVCNYMYVPTALYTANSNKLNSSRNFKPLACRIYWFMDLVYMTLLHQSAKATHTHCYNTFVLFTQWFTVELSLPIKKECISPVFHFAIMAGFTEFTWYWLKASYIILWSKFTIGSNINLQQNVYPKCDVTLISVLMNSFMLYVKRSIKVAIHKQY